MRTIIKSSIFVRAELVSALFLTALISLCLSSAPDVNVCKASPPTTTVGLESLVLSSSSGTNVPVFQHDGRKATLYFILATTCPISNYYAPDIRRLTSKYGQRGVRTYTVLIDDSLTLGQAEEYKHEYQILCPVLCDPLHHLTTVLGAVVTPEAIVVGSNGALLYRGRIDNKFANFGVARLEPTSFDLSECLDDIVAGRPVKFHETKAIGCFIPSVSG